MNQLKDIFNVQFFVILGIVLLLVTCLVLYVEQKIKSHDHKLSSMLSLVSSLAEEIDFFKKNNTSSQDTNALQEVQTHIHNLNESLESNKLIDVSDDEGNSSGSDYESIGNNSDSDSNSDPDSEDESNNSDNESNSENDSIIILQETNSDVHKIVNTIDLGNIDNDIITIKKIKDIQLNNIVDLDDTNEMDELDDTNDLNELDELDDANDLNEIDELDDVNDLNDIDELNIDDKTPEIEEDEEGLDDIDDINDIDDESDDTKDNVVDYNKLSVPKLKEIALEKKLITTTSNKLKKADLLKLLEVH